MKSSVSVRSSSKSTASTPLSSELAEATHFRLCHRCSHLNQSDRDVLRCGRCHLRLSFFEDPNAPFDPDYEAQEMAAELLGDAEDEAYDETTLPQLLGFSAVWK